MLFRSAQTHAHTHTYTHTHIHTHTRTHTYTYIHTHTHTHTHTYTHIHARTHTYTYTHIHTHCQIHTQLMAEAEVAAAQKLLESAEMEMMAARDGQAMANQVCVCLSEHNHVYVELVQTGRSDWNLRRWRCWQPGMAKPWPTRCVCLSTYFMYM